MTPRPSGLRALEPWLYATVLSAVWGAELFCSFVMHRPADTAPGWFFHERDPFGFFWLRGLGAWLPVVYSGIALVIIAVRRGARAIPRRVVFLVPLALASFAVLYGLRTGFLNPDGVAFSTDIPRGVAAAGTYFTHDEILELHLHARLWVHLHAAFGTSVTEAYQLASCTAGALFMVILVCFASELADDAPGWLLLGVCAGGYMQLFFGDVENYTLTTLLIAAYLWAAFRTLHRGGSVLLPSLLLGVAMCFHLLAGWLGVSLLYLWVRELRLGRWRAVLAAVACFLVVLATALWWTTLYVPLRNLYYGTHAMGHGGNMAAMLVTPTVHYYRRIGDLSFLLLPIWPLLPALMLCGRVSLDDPFNRFLALALSFLVAFMCSWNAQLGAYNDWNLFSPVAFVAAVMLFYNLVRVEAAWRGWILGAAIMLSATHSYAWIVSNHRFVMPP